MNGKKAKQSRALQRVTEKYFDGIRRKLREEKKLEALQVMQVYRAQLRALSLFKRILFCWRLLWNI